MWGNAPEILTAKCVRPVGNIHDYALRSVRSLLHSLAVTDSTIVLNERFLTEIAVNKWMSRNKSSECLSGTPAAETEGALLSAEVKLGEEQHI